jgi:hypothetical protein
MSCTLDQRTASIAIMDVSGSMGEFEKYIARSFYFWMVRFLRTKYNNVQIVFVSHHTEAKEVTEEEFFHKGESGDTQVSSAYELALDIIKERYNPDDWNIYPFHFSDGDNLPWDNDRCMQLVNKLMELCTSLGMARFVRGITARLVLSCRPTTSSTTRSLSPSPFPIKKRSIPRSVNSLPSVAMRCLPGKGAQEVSDANTELSGVFVVASTPGTRVRTASTGFISPSMPSTSISASVVCERSSESRAP